MRRRRDRPVAMRLVVTGETPLHDELVLDRTSVREEVETLLETLPQEVWLEKLEIATTRPPAPEVLDPTVAGRLVAEVQRLINEGRIAAALEEELTAIRDKLPGSNADKSSIGCRKSRGGRPRWRGR